MVVLTLPMEELALFFSKLESLLTIVRAKTGSNFAPIALQRSLFCPMDEFMIVLHKVSHIDVKLPRISYYKTPKQISGAFTL